MLQEYSKLHKAYNPDIVIVNIENITSGKWPIEEHARFIASFWVDVMTGGDHIFDNYENISQYLNAKDSKLIRPSNFYNAKSLPGSGYKIIQKNDKKIVIIQLLWEVFMNHKVENPFLHIDSLLLQEDIASCDIKIVEFHRETTAELYGLARYLDGRVHVVYGTHTHIQTNDAHILEKGTWILTDVGMNGPFEGVIGADFESVKHRFLSGIQRGKIAQKETGKYIINALLCEIDDITGKTATLQTLSYTWQ